MSDGSANLRGGDLPAHNVATQPQNDPVCHPRFAAGVSRYVVQRGLVLQSIISDFKDVMEDIIRTQGVLKEANQQLESGIAAPFLGQMELECVADRLHRMAHLAQTIDAATGQILLHFNRTLKVALGELVEFGGQIDVAHLPLVSNHDGQGAMKGIVDASKLALMQLDLMLENRTLAGRQAVRSRQAIDIPGLFADLRKRTACSAVKVGVPVRTRISPSVQKCWVNDDWLQTILGNLVDNAIHASAPDAEVSIEARPDGPHAIEIEVSTSSSDMSVEDARAALMIFGVHDQLYTEEKSEYRIGEAVEFALLQVLGMSKTLTSHPAGRVGVVVRLETYKHEQ